MLLSTLPIIPLLLPPAVALPSARSQCLSAICHRQKVNSSVILLSLKQLEKAEAQFNSSKKSITECEASCTGGLFTGEVALITPYWWSLYHDSTARMITDINPTAGISVANCCPLRSVGFYLLSLEIGFAHFNERPQAWKKLSFVFLQQVVVFWQNLVLKESAVKHEWFLFTKQCTSMVPPHSTLSTLGSSVYNLIMQALHIPYPTLEAGNSIYWTQKNGRLSQPQVGYLGWNLDCEHSLGCSAVI